MQPRSQAITGATVWVGDELQPVADATVLVEEGVIRAAGSARAVPVPQSAERFDASSLTVIPGFIDAHVHIAFFEPIRVLEGGVTTARDLGWPAHEIFELSRSSQSRSFDGPRILAAGSMLTVERGYPTRAAWAPRGTGLVVEREGGPERAVQTMAAQGAAVIKVALNAAVGPTLAEHTLARIVQAAHDRGLKVTGHVAGLVELVKALNAGLDELAHMPMSRKSIPDELLGRAAGSGMAIVPTLSIFSGRARRRAIEDLARFLAAGGRVVYGTDLGNAGPQPGIDRREVDAMAEAGMSTREIVASATVDSARWLGLDRAGSVEAGRDADLVAIQGGDQRARSLTHIAHVWRGGRRI